MTKSLDYRWDDNHHTPKIVETLEKIVGNPKCKSSSHLDIGCGNGMITVKLVKFFKNTLGIDLSNEGINFAKKLKSKNIKFINSSVESLKKKKKKFDFFSAIEVVEHQYDPVEFIQLVDQVTTKNGYALISTPFHGYLKNLLISLFNGNDRHYTVLWKHGHIKFFSVNTFKELISTSKVKLKIEKIYFSGRFFPFSHSMIFLLKKK